MGNPDRSRVASTPMSGKRFAFPVLLALLALAIPVSASAAGATTDGGVKEVSFFVLGNNHRNYLQLDLYPTAGVAVASINEENRSGAISGRGVAYAIAIPARPFEGSLDIRFPGLGEFVGTVTPDLPFTAMARAEACDSRDPSEGGTFKGRVRFRQASGHGHWSANEEQVGLMLECSAHLKRENGDHALFGHVAELGPDLYGPAPIRFFAQGEARDRYLEFIAWAGKGRPNHIEFNAVDREWLHGDIATERWVKVAPASLSKAVRFGLDAGEATSATFTPPAPFFGKGVYRRSTEQLTGSLGVNFAGLKLRLTPSPLPATLEDELTEEGRRRG
jgi:hypothetical protein